MLHVATVHYRSAEWLEVQSRYLKRYLPADHKIWGSLEGISDSYSRYFDRVLEQAGPHAGKLNHLAAEICDGAPASDLIMFLDGDAFPIADVTPLLSETLSRAPLVAIMRSENAGDRQPHPSFCVTSVGTWRSLGGDWSAGAVWHGELGPMTDVGGNLLRRLEVSETPWVPLTRTNGSGVHPLLFGIYGDTIYHHGAGFRWVWTRADETEEPAAIQLPSQRAQWVVNRIRRSAWRRQRMRRNSALSSDVYQRIAQGGDDWLTVVRR